MLSQRLMLIPISSMEDMLDMEDIMVLAMLDTDRLDTHMPTTERDLLMLSQRLMLMLTLDTMDMEDIMVLAMLDTDMLDTHMPTMERDLLMLSQRLMLMLMPSIDTMERDLLMLSQRLMLTTDTMDMPDLMPLDTEVLDTEDTTWDKSYTLSKNSTKQKLKANNIQL